MRRGGLLRGRGPRLSALFTDDVEDVLKTDGRGGARAFAVGVVF